MLMISALIGRFAVRHGCCYCSLELASSSRKRIEAISGQKLNIALKARPLGLQPAIYQLLMNNDIR